MSHTNNGAGEPHVSVQFEYPHRPSGGGVYRFVVKVVAPVVLNPERRRPPLDLAFVIDRSGSMGGGKLELVKLGVEHALRLLDDRDTLSVTVYDDTIDTPTPQRRFSQGTRGGVLRRLHSIHPRGSTNLAGGWLAGCNELAGIADGTSPLRRSEGRAVCRALLLTDGLANVGMVDPSSIATHAAELQQRGISTSTFGVGYDFDELLLGQMADAGGGRYHFIGSSHDVPRVFAGELGEMLTLVARDAVLSLRIPRDWNPEILNTLPVTPNGDWIDIRLNDLASRDERVLVWEATLPEVAEGHSELLEARLRWSTPNGEQTIERTQRHDLRAQREPGTANTTVLDEAARMYAVRARSEALELNRAGAYDSAVASSHAYAARMPASPVGAAMAHELLAEVPLFAQEMRPEQRKDRHFVNRNLARQQRDHSKPAE